MAIAVDPRVVIHPLTLERYERMVETGLFNNDDHVELLNGMLCEMTPQGAEHAALIQWLTTQFIVALAPGTASVRGQLPLALPPASMPEPDLAVVPPGDYADAHPGTALLVIEIAMTSQRVDLGTKAEIYAAAQLPELWVVDVPARTVHVHGAPADGRYTAIEPVTGGPLSAAFAGAPDIDVSAMFALLPR